MNNIIIIVTTPPGFLRLLHYGNMNYYYYIIIIVNCCYYCCSLLLLSLRLDFLELIHYYKYYCYHSAWKYELLFVLLRIIMILLLLSLRLDLLGCYITINIIAITLPGFLKLLHYYKSNPTAQKLLLSFHLDSLDFITKNITIICWC